MDHHLTTVYNHYSTLQVFLIFQVQITQLPVVIEVVFTNGCRAPPWRQAHGDICYLQVNAYDVDVFHVTASTEGYYVNGVRMCVHIFLPLLADYRESVLMVK